MNGPAIGAGSADGAAAATAEHVRTKASELAARPEIRMYPSQGIVNVTVPWFHRVVAAEGMSGGRI
ncbi:MAG TPA: hypothetical protein VGF02_07390, partial [Pseudolabrys sp.]